MVEKRTFFFRVEDRAAGLRLDRLVSNLLPELSRNRIQKLISSGLITVNDRPAPKRYTARSSDVLRVEIPPPPPAAPRPEEIALDILYEDDDILAVNKPSGMVVHPAPGHPGGTLVNALLHRVGKLSAFGEPVRPGIIHRIDKDTSGLVLVAKNDLAHRRCASQFARRTVSKTYVAVSSGRLRKESGTWNMPIGRDPKSRKKISSRSGRPRQAVTRWRRLRSLEGADLLELHPETGRTHQIRVHLAESGHPVLGDPIYGPKARRGSSYHAASRRLGFAGRLALHAWKISCRHPRSGEKLELEAPLPPELERLFRP